uniref:tRNA-intron lyase n=1 Tax=Caenorhabditis tropicalis TaxID=1561998 RepID=A0A1I7UZ46_9PELO
MDELVAVLVEFGIADVYRIGGHTVEGGGERGGASGEGTSSGDPTVGITVEGGEEPTVTHVTSSEEAGGSGITVAKTLLRIEEIPFENTKEFRAKRLVVRDFWRKGFFIADGTRFGGDYLVYTSSPNECHAQFVLLCTPITDSQRIAAMRCCNQVKKTLILATMSSDSTQPHYTKCEWFRPELF